MPVLGKGCFPYITHIKHTASEVFCKGDLYGESKETTVWVLALPGPGSL